MINNEKSKISLSLLVMIVFIAFIWVIRVLTPCENTLTWDVFGYYLWLPAKFIKDDIWLDKIEWVKAIIEKYKTTETLYQAYIGPNGTWMFWFLFGMGIMYMPFFFIAHLWAKAGGFEADGFSLPYQYAIGYGSVIYTCIGLVYMRKVLKQFFNETTVAGVLIILVLGTNYLFYTAIGGAATANFLFSLIAALIWYTIKWHENPSIVFAVILAIICGLIVLIKPSEIFCVLIPILWNISESKLRVQKRDWLKKYWWHLIIMVIVGIVVLFPQLFYWKQESGKWIYDSYNNPGIGLDIFSPHIWEVLFSFRKGWLIYSPIMIFALIGFWQMYKRRKDLVFVIGVYFVISFYIISSWTEWWYGGGFGHRPLVATYAALALPLGFFIEELLKRKILRFFIGIVIIFFIALNLFQIWQFQNYILPEDRITFKYYTKVFGKTERNEDDQKYLSVQRSFGLIDDFSNSQDYNMRNIGLYDFEEGVYPDFKKFYSEDTAHSGRMCLNMDSVEYSPEIRTSYAGITYKDHAWIKASVWFYFSDSCFTETPLLVVSITHNNGNYKYRTKGFNKSEILPRVWNKLELVYQTPEIRSVSDEIVIYVWNRSKNKVLIDDLKADAFTVK